MIDAIIKYISAFASIIVIVLVLLVVYDASARYIYSTGSIALQELEWHLFDVIILLGISYTLKQDAHVRVDIFYASFTKKKKALLNLISAIFFVLPFSFLIIYISLDFVQMSFIQHETSSNPGGLAYRYLVKALLPVSFLFLVLQALQVAQVNFKEWRSL